MCYETEPKKEKIIILLLIIITLWLLHRTVVSRFFFHLCVYYWIIHLLSIPCPNRTDSSLHSIKSVSLILLLHGFLFFVFFCSSCQKQWALLNNAWRMMNYGQEWHIKKNGPFTSLYGSLMWTGISHEIPFTWPSQHARILR